MRKFGNLFFVTIMLLYCACQSSQDTQSAFIRNFDLHSIVEKTSTPSLRLLKGTGGQSTTTKKTSESRRAQTVEYEIIESESERFDKADFLNQIKLGVASAVGETATKTESGGSGDEAFYFGYQEKNIKGSVEVIGARVEGNRYKLWCIVREHEENLSN